MVKKRGQLWDTLLPWIIGVGVLALALFLYLLLSGRLSAIGEYISNIVRFGR